MYIDSMKNQVGEARFFFVCAGIGEAGVVGGRDHITKRGDHMAVHPCPRCKKLIPVGVAYCDDCRPLADQQAAEAIERRAEYKRKKYNAQYNSKRDPKYLTFYRSKDWKLTSKTKLQTVAYKCEAQLEGCTHLAVEVHHIKPIQTPEGWDRRMDWDNLEALCINCHNKRHARFKKKAQNGVIDLRTVKR